MRIALTIGATILLTTGCSTVTSTDVIPIPRPGDAACAQDGLDLFLGKKATAAFGATMLKASGAKILRWVAPGMAVTMDYSPDRLTVSYDKNYTILRVSCG